MVLVQQNMGLLLRASLCAFLVVGFGTRSSAQPERPIPIINPRFLHRPPNDDITGGYEAAILAALTTWRLSAPLDSIYRGLTVNADPLCWTEGRCHDLPLSSLVMIRIRPYSMEILGSILREVSEKYRHQAHYRYEDQDEMPVKSMEASLENNVWVLVSPTDLETGEPKRVPSIYIVAGVFDVPYPNFMLDKLGAPLLLFDPLRNKRFKSKVGFSELSKTSGLHLQVITVEDISRDAQLNENIPQISLVSEKEAQEVQSKFSGAMRNVVNEFDKEVSRIPLVELPPNGNMFFRQEKSGYRTESLLALRNSTMRKLLQTSSAARLVGMYAYVDKFFPMDNLHEQGGVVSSGQGLGFIASLRAFVVKIADVSQHLTTEFRFKSLPEPATLTLATGGGVLVQRVPSPVLVKNLYRGFYSYQVDLTDYKAIKEDNLNLIDQNIRELGCYLVPIPENRDAYPCYQKTDNDK
jgi:hypothetical protein